MKWLLVFAVFMPALSFANIGNDAGGGGNAVVCRDSKKVITSAESLDLFEARVLYQWTVPSSSVPALEQALRISEDLGLLNHRWNLRFELYNDIVKRIRILSPEYKLEPIADAFPSIGKKGCEIEQLARYQRNGDLLVDGEIWAALDETSKAALYLHETFYKDLRIVNGAKNSLRARRAVGFAMASDSTKIPIQPAADQPVEMTCGSINNDGGVRFAVTFETRLDVQLIGFYFSVLDSHPALGQTFGQILGDYEFIKNPKPGLGTTFTIRSFFERDTEAAMTFVKKTKQGSLWKFSYERNISNEEQSVVFPEKEVDILCTNHYSPDDL